jgi:hypothetical protein
MISRAAVLIVSLLILTTGAACGNSEPYPELIALTERVVVLEELVASSQKAVTRLTACAEATSPNEFCDVDAAQANNIMAAHAKIADMEQTVASLTANVTGATQKSLDGINKTIITMKQLDASVVRALKKNQDAVDSLIPPISHLCGDDFIFEYSDGCEIFNKANP